MVTRGSGRHHAQSTGRGSAPSDLVAPARAHAWQNRRSSAPGGIAYGCGQSCHLSPHLGQNVLATPASTFSYYPLFRCLSMLYDYTYMAALPTHAYVARSAAGDVARIDLPIEDALPALRDLARDRNEKVSLHRVADGVKVAVAGNAVSAADVRDPGWRHLPHHPDRPPRDRDDD